MKGFELAEIRRRHKARERKHPRAQLRPPSTGIVRDLLTAIEKAQLTAAFFTAQGLPVLEWVERRSPTIEELSRAGWLLGLELRLVPVPAVADPLSHASAPETPAPDPARAPPVDTANPLSHDDPTP